MSDDKQPRRPLPPTKTATLIGTDPDTGEATRRTIKNPLCDAPDGDGHDRPRR